MSQLSYKVECKSTCAFFEVIAAFDCDYAALCYAQMCAAVNASCQYRVKKGKLQIAAFNMREG